METEGELLKADKLYSILVDEKMLGMLEEQSEENENEEDREAEDKFEGKEKGEKNETKELREEDMNRLSKVTNKRMLELIDKEGLKGNVSEGSTGWKSKTRPRLKMEEEGGLGGNCVSSKLLVRTQQWKKDGALLVRTFYPADSIFPDFRFDTHSFLIGRRFSFLFSSSVESSPFFSTVSSSSLGSLQQSRS